MRLSLGIRTGYNRRSKTSRELIIVMTSELLPSSYVLIPSGREGE